MQFSKLYYLSEYFVDNIIIIIYYARVKKTLK